MGSFVVQSEPVLSVVIKVSVGSCHILDLGWFEKEALLALSPEAVRINSRPLSFWVHDVLMVEVLVGSQKVLAISERNLSLSILISSNNRPNFSYLILFTLPSLLTNKSQFKEYLWHWSATNIGIMDVTVRCSLLDNSKIFTSPVEVLVEPIMKNFIWGRVNNSTINFNFS